MENIERKAMAKMLMAQPLKAELPMQKFKRGSRVRICEKLLGRGHFPSDLDAIVEYTYAQRYWGDDVDNYSLLVLDNNGCPMGSNSWYFEADLTLLSDDINAGLKIIERYQNDNN